MVPLHSSGDQVMNVMAQADPSTWSTRLHELVRSEQTSLIPYELKLTYDHWTHRKLSVGFAFQAVLIY